MPGNPHPADTALATRDATAIAADEKIGLRRTVADADEIRNGDFTGQFAGLEVRSNNRLYALDTSSVAEDDGSESIIDAAGNHFVAQSGQGTTQIDFGSVGCGDTSIDVTGLAGISADAIARAWIVAQDSDDRPADEHWVDPPIVTPGNVVAGTGFTIYARSTGGRLTGAYSVAYEWKN